MCQTAMLSVYVHASDSLVCKTLVPRQRLAPTVLTWDGLKQLYDTLPLI